MALFAALRLVAEPATVDALETLVTDAPEAALCRINALDLAARQGLPEEDVIAALLHAARLGIFELSWNVLCPGCGGVLGTGASLKTVDQPSYQCSLCAAGYEATLDELVEVTFTVSPRVRRIAAHDPNTLPWLDYFRHVFWGSGVDQPAGLALDDIMDQVVLDAIELPAHQTAQLSLQVEPGFVILFDPVLHVSQFIEVSGEPTRERQALTVMLGKGLAHAGTVQLRPGPLRVTLENQSELRTLPGVWLAGDALHALLGRRRPFLTAARLLTNQTFRELYGGDLLSLQQKLKITSLTFLFTDLQSSTELYEKVGDLSAYDLVQNHFRVLQDIVAGEGGAVVKTIGDSVMATFISPLPAMRAALRMREAIGGIEGGLALKIGVHEGPCLAVMLNDRQDYFGQTVNIAARVQGLCQPRFIFTTSQVMAHAGAAALLADRDCAALEGDHLLRGVSRSVGIHAIL
jgi:class 3 adenylate cyclase